MAVQPCANGLERLLYTGSHLGIESMDNERDDPARGFRRNVINSVCQDAAPLVWLD